MKIVHYLRGRNPVFLAMAGIAVICVIAAPWYFSLLFGWAATEYWQMSDPF